MLRHSEGLKRVLRLVNGKFLANYKINQLLNHGYDIKFNTAILPPANFDLNSNYWLSGFSDADGSFEINIPSTPSGNRAQGSEAPLFPITLPAVGLPTPSPRSPQPVRAVYKLPSPYPLRPHYMEPETPRTGRRSSPGDGCLRLVSYPFLCSAKQELTQRELVFGYKIKQGRIHNFISPARAGPVRSHNAAHNGILKIIHEFFGGNIYFLDREQVFYYNSASAAPNVAVFNYFDKFQLNSSKLIRYLKWRQAYRIVQRKEHLTEKGLNKIRKLQGNLRD